jgi:hypothetical protein
MAVGGGFLQSLVEATSARIRQTYLRRLYDEVHSLEGTHGEALYYTAIILSPECIGNLIWWKEFLSHNPGQTSRSGTASSLSVTWGDGSGTGTGGTVERQHDMQVETWMGAWHPRVLRHSSNWKELRTLLWTIERMGKKQVPVAGTTVFYVTDNMPTYYIVQNGSSKSTELHRLIRDIKLWEALH